MASGQHLDHLNEAVRLTEILPASRLAETEYGRDFLPLIPHFYELCCSLGAQGDITGAIGFHRKRHEPDFTDRDQEIVNLLLPHLSRALHHLDLIEAITSSHEMGIIEMGADGQPRSMNEAARRALNGSPVKTLPDPGWGAGPALFRTATRTYRIRTVCKGRQGKTLLLEPIPAGEDLQVRLKVFGLSRREEEIALLAIRGFSNHEIAERLFICEQTVKDHLRDIFEKVCVHRRSELTATVLGLRPPQR